jgi:hypothetical protein
MQVRMVDAVKVHRLRERAVRLMHSNNHDAKLMGVAMHDAMNDLDLWKEVRNGETVDSINGDSKLPECRGNTGRFCEQS